MAFWTISDAGMKLKYRTMRDGNWAWTEDVNEAIHFSRRRDAEKVSAEDDEAWMLIRHEGE